MQDMANNGNFEARNSKSETNSNDRNTKFGTLSFWKFEDSDLGFVSSFDIRISDFKEFSNDQ